MIVTRHFPGADSPPSAAARTSRRAEIPALLAPGLAVTGKQAATSESRYSRCRSRPYRFSCPTKAAGPGLLPPGCIAVDKRTVQNSPPMARLVSARQFRHMRSPSTLRRSNQTVGHQSVRHLLEETVRNRRSRPASCQALRRVSHRSPMGLRDLSPAPSSRPQLYRRHDRR